MTLKFIQDNIFLIALAFVSGAMLIMPSMRRGVGGGAQLTTLQATQMMNREDALVLDIRDATDFAAGHIINARNIPGGELDRRVEEIARWKSKRVIVTCANGMRSGAALSVLKKHGFQSANALAGGFKAWQQAGLPTAK